MTDQTTWTGEKVQFNATIPSGLREAIKKTRLDYSRIVELGMDHYLHQQDSQNTIATLIDGNAKLQAKLSELAQKIKKLEEEQ